MKIWVYGAGAVGTFYGLRLYQAGNQVLFVARGQHLAALQSKGLTLIGLQGEREEFPEIQACHQEQLAEQFSPDLVIVATKRYSNPQVVEVLRRVLADHPAVPIYVFQNGICSERLFQEAFGEERVLRAILKVSTSLDGPGQLRYRGGGFIDLAAGPLAQELMNDLNRVEVPGKLHRDLKEAIWKKILWNASFNSLTALTRLWTSDLLNQAEGDQLVRAIMEEVILLSKRQGVQFPSDIIEKTIQDTLQKFGNISTSTLEDIKAGKPLEVDAILGDLLEEADHQGVSVPHLQMLHRLLKLLALSTQLPR